MKKGIIVFGSGSLGDTIFRIPAIRHIREHYPNHTLIFLSADREGLVAPEVILEPMGLVDVFEKYKPTSRKIDHIRTFIRFRALIKYYAVDDWIFLSPDLSRTFVHSFLTAKIKLAGAKRVFGFPRQKVDEKGILKRQEAVAQVSWITLLNLEQSGFPVFEGTFESISLSITEDEKEQASRIISSILPLSSCKITFLGVGMGGKKSCCRWSIRNYVLALSKICSDNKIVPVFFGGGGDASDADEVIMQIGRGVNLCGKIAPRISAAVMMHCPIFIGNDTGTIHLAASAGCSCVGLYATHSYFKKWYPLCNNSIVLAKKVPCSGCIMADCPMPERCIDRISPDEVIEAYLTLRQMGNAERVSVSIPDKENLELSHIFTNCVKRLS